MTNASLCAIVLAVSLAAAARPAASATYRVDDSASIPRESTALLGWRDAVPTRGGSDTLEGTIGVALRLDLGPWRNRSGRLFLVLPEQATPVVQLSWRTQGRLLPGRVVPGQRVLVYEGLISTPFIDERLELGIEASGERLAGTQPVNFHFEIDVD
jgi:hypothetical protein